MEQRISSWKRRAAALPGRAQGRRYPEQMRGEAVQLVDAALAAGVTEQETCDALGVPVITVRAWRRAHALVPVRIVDEPRAPLRMRVGPAVVELTVEQLVDVLRALG